MRYFFVRYKFTNKLAVSAGEEFQAKLEQLDQKLYDNNLNIIPLPEIIRTVCFWAACPVEWLRAQWFLFNWASFLETMFAAQQVI